MVFIGMIGVAGVTGHLTGAIEGHVEGDFHRGFDVDRVFEAIVAALAVELGMAAAAGTFQGLTIG